MKPSTHTYFDCEADNCGRQADNEIRYYDNEEQEVYSTFRCEQHTLLEAHMEDMAVEYRNLRTGLSDVIRPQFDNLMGRNEWAGALEAL